MTLPRLLALALALLVFTMVIAGCSDDEPVVLPDATEKATCEGCHVDEAMLKATALPDEPVESEGEG